jgi:predicted AAA+ superfamily ATPase
MEFKRKVYDKMLKWKNEYAPNYALFLKGARRVGKSTLALKLGKEEYKSFIEIRFDKAPNEIKELFVNSLEDLDYLFNKLQIFYKTRLYVRESLIILDEHLFNTNFKLGNTFKEFSNAIQSFGVKLP